MLNSMEFNKINDFQQSVTHTHSEKNIYINPHLAYLDMGNKPTRPSNDLP